MSQQSHIDREILRFLHGEMSTEKRNQFRARIVKDEAYAVRYAELAVEVNGQEDLRQQLQDIRFKRSKSLWAQPAMRWAAAAVLVLGLFAASNLLFNPWTEQDHFAEHFAPYSDWSYSRGQEPAQVLWAQSVEAYRNQDYRSAIDQLESAPDSLKQQLPLQQLFLGVSYLSLDPPNTDQAIRYLKQTAHSTHAYKDAARWYLALAYFKAEQPEQAQAELQVLREDSASAYQQKAEELLEELR